MADHLSIGLFGASPLGYSSQHDRRYAFDTQSNHRTAFSFLGTRIREHDAWPGLALSGPWSAHRACSLPAATLGSNARPGAGKSSPDTRIPSRYLRLFDDLSLSVPDELRDRACVGLARRRPDQPERIVFSIHEDCQSSRCIEYRRQNGIGGSTQAFVRDPRLSASV